MSKSTSTNADLKLSSVDVDLTKYQEAQARLAKAVAPVIRELRQKYLSQLKIVGPEKE